MCVTPVFRLSISSSVPAERPDQRSLQNRRDAGVSRDGIATCTRSSEHQPRRSSVSGIEPGSGSTPPKFIPRPPPVEERVRPRTAGSARPEDAWNFHRVENIAEPSQDETAQEGDDRGDAALPYSSNDDNDYASRTTRGTNDDGAAVVVENKNTTQSSGAPSRIDHKHGDQQQEQREQHQQHRRHQRRRPRQNVTRKPKDSKRGTAISTAANRRPASASRAVRGSFIPTGIRGSMNENAGAAAAVVATERVLNHSSDIWLDGSGEGNGVWCATLRVAHARRATAEPGAASRAAAAVRASAVSNMQQQQQQQQLRRHTFSAGGRLPSRIKSSCSRQATTAYEGEDDS